MKKILSIIPARGNSKGIQLKNLAKLNGNSLLYYTVNASLKSKFINTHIVKTKKHSKNCDYLYWLKGLSKVVLYAY